MATITVSREYGSGGDEVAIRVSELLGYHYFDKTLMAQIVKETGLTEGEMVDFSEDNYKAQTFLDRLLGWRDRREIGRVSSWGEDLTGTRSREMAILNESQGIALVQGAVRAAHKRGNVVIVGRGGQAILRGLPDVLHVRIQAPDDVRFRRISSRETLHLLGLQKEIEAHDQATADYLRRFYDIDWADPSLYDVIINMVQLSVEAAAQMIVVAARSLPEPQLTPEAVA